MGIEPTDTSVVVVRSGYHFSLNFSSIGPCITVDTPGLTSYRVAELPFNLARPFYPLDDIGFLPTARVRRR
jgi:microcystin degradation protein MlrC